MTNQGAGVTPLEVYEPSVVFFFGPGPEYSSPLDCNDNDRSDASDIVLGRSRDEDGDGVPDECSQARFRRGDSDASGRLNVTDAVVTLNHLFLGRGDFACADAADADDSGRLDLSDAVFTLDYLFLRGATIPWPFPGCSVDRTDDGLDCDAFAPCVPPLDLTGPFFGHTPASPGVVFVLDGSRETHESGCFARVVEAATEVLLEIEGNSRAQFAIVVFSGSLINFPGHGRPAEANPAQVAAGIGFLRAVAPPDRDGACFREGILRGLQLADRISAPRKELLFASRIVAECPGHDMEQYVQQTLAAVPAANFKRHAVHTFGLFPEETSPRQNLIDALAEANGGTSRNVEACE